MTKPYTPRPREKLATASAQKLSDHELLQALIGSGSRTLPVKSIARSVMRLFRKTQGQLTYADLRTVPGLGSAYASRIMAALELARRWQSFLYTPQTVVPLRSLMQSKTTPTVATVVCDLYNAAHEVVDRLFIEIRQNEAPVTLIRSILVQTAPTQAVIMHVGIIGDPLIRKESFSDMLFIESLRATLSFIDVSLRHVSSVSTQGVVMDVHL
jgi:hypothetical protein